MVGQMIALMLAAGPMSSGFEVRTVAGEMVIGDVKEVAADGSVTLAHGKKFGAGDWYSLRQGILPPWPHASHVELTTGDRLAGTIIDADGDALRLKLAGTPNQSVHFPLSAVRVVWLINRPADAVEPDWLTAPRKRDVIQARNGDVVIGSLIGIDAPKNALRYQSDSKDHQLELSKLGAVGFNTDLARVRKPKGPYFRLTLTNGTRLNVTSVAFDGTTWTAVTPFKDSIKIPSDQMVSVDVEQNKVIYLSDLKPTKYQYEPFDGEMYTWIADRTATGRAMGLKTTAGESMYDRGVGLHAECTIAYSLAGKYRRFETLAGLDSRSGIRGDATLAVLVDGKEQTLPGGGRLTHAGGPIAVRVEVNGAKELTIIIRRGAGANIQDHVNLAEARLVP